MTPRKPTKTEKDRQNTTNMNFETTISLRNAFKAKVAMHGKTVKQVLEDFMKEYIKK